MKTLERERALLLLTLEVRDCECWKTYWHEHCRQVRQGEESIPPPPRCKHLLEADHAVELLAWKAFCLAFDPRGYADPPLPPEPRVFLTWADAVHVYADRTQAGYAMRHPDDVFHLERVSVEAMKGRTQGRLILDEVTP